MGVSTRNGPSRGRPKVLYADLDGTLLGPGGSLFAAEGGGLTVRAAEALVALSRAEIALVLMSGRTRRGLHEAARVLGASAYLAELGALLVEGREVTFNLGAYPGTGRPFDAIVRQGAGAVLLERFPDRLRPEAPWTEATAIFVGLVDVSEAEAILRSAGFGWLALHDNGRLRRIVEGLDLPEVRVYHLLPRGVSKASGVRLHRERHRLAMQEVAAVGDSPADLAVAAEVGHLYLVLNGLVALGDEPLPSNVSVTGSGYGDGFADAVTSLLEG